MTIRDFIAAVEARKAAAGVTDAEIEAARNPGILRTAEKRAAIARIQERARAAGLTPLPANL